MVRGMTRRVEHVQNNATQTLRFLNWRLEAPTALVTVASYLLGMISGWTVVGFLSRSFRRVTEEQRR